MGNQQHGAIALRLETHTYLVAWHIVGLLDHVNLVQEAWKKGEHGGQHVCANGGYENNRQVSKGVAAPPFILV